MTVRSDEPVIVEVRDGAMYVTLNRPEVLNAQNTPMREGLVAAYERFDDDDDLRVLVLRGAGRAFSAGADLKEFVGVDAPPPRDRRSMEHFARLERVRKPVIACIHGYAVGGGLEVALCADIRIATVDAKLGTPEARTNGGIPSIAVHRLARLIPHGEAMRIMLTSQPISGQRAFDIGLVQELAADVDEMLGIAQRYVTEISECSPRSIGTIKRLARWTFLADVGESQRFQDHEAAFPRGAPPRELGADYLAQRRAARGD